MTRQEKAILHHELIILLNKDVKDDDDFFNRLLYSLEIISKELSYYTIDKQYKI